MTTMIRCEDCGTQQEYDEDTDAPVPHACGETDFEDEGYRELNFDE